MPSFQTRRVSFSPPNYSRLPRDDEAYVMKAFARHASHCKSCNDPYIVHRTGGTLCPKGHQRALDVAQYVYSKGGKAYSLVDREGNQRVQIEIPTGCEPVRSLLKAMERGLRIMKSAPLVSHDRTYYIPPRPVSERRPSTKELKLEMIQPPAWAEEYEPLRSTGSYVGKGSLYASDMKERERYYANKPPVYYRVNTDPGPRPPVPPKDYY